MEKHKYDELQKRIMSTSGWDEAVDYLENYIKNNPDSLEAYLIRGELHLEMGDFQKALNDLEKVIRIDTNIAQSYFSRGMLYANSGDNNKALNDFSKAIELDENYIEAYSNRANMYLKLKEVQKAINDCTKAIELMPSDNESPEPYYNRGLAYMNINKAEKALEDYCKVIELAPDNAEAYAKRGLIYSGFGRTQEAINDYEKFLQLDPDNKNAYLVKDELNNLKSGKTVETVENNKEPVNKELRLLLICSAICFFIGTIMGASSGNVLMGMWFGLGSGVALSFFPDIPGIFRIAYREEGFEGFVEALKSTFIGGGIWFVIFMIAGPIGFIIRFIKMR